eukprot:440446_1
MAKPSLAVSKNSCFSYNNKIALFQESIPCFGFNILHWNKRKFFNTCIAGTPQAHSGHIIDNGSSTRGIQNKAFKVKDGSVPRIAIIGGGICGVTAAKAILSRIKTIAPNQKVDITIFEADPNAFNKSYPPKWKAATARNANSIVPGAAMHIMSQRMTLLDIARDTIREQYLTLRDGNISKRDFRDVPPYFGFGIIRCIGWSASWEERLCFFNFFMHFIKTSLLTGDHEAERRGKLMVQMAKANRFALSMELEKMSSSPLSKMNSTSNSHFGLQTGFISIHRTREKSIKAVEEAKHYGEEARIITEAQAIDLEPNIANIPVNNLHFVYRPNDKVANCAKFVRTVIQSLKTNGVKYHAGNPVHSITTSYDHLNSAPHFFVTINDREDTSHTCTESFDMLVLAAGIFTPVIAAKLGAAQSCPLYPLRGFSLTMANVTQDESNLEKKGENFLRHPFSFDNIYCTSVAPTMVRLAGFGEIIGFPKKGKESAYSPGPMVIEKYSNIFLKPSKNLDMNSDQNSRNKALPCYRPLSPDDVPLVGRVEAVPGLFLHSGHGTLGWTLSLATAHCLAQDVCQTIMGHTSDSQNGIGDDFVLPDGSSISRIDVSPDRFRF